MLALNWDHTLTSVFDSDLSQKLTVTYPPNFQLAVTRCCVASLNQLPMVHANPTRQPFRLRGLPSRHCPYGTSTESPVGVASATGMTDVSMGARYLSADA